MDKTVGLLFEDLAVSEKFRSAAYQMTGDRIKEFATEFDPQQFHVDNDAAGRSLFKGLAASGWHTAAVTMRLFVQRMKFSGGAIGLGVDELRWPTAVRAGDELLVETEILELRESHSRKQFGVVKFRNVTYNQRDEIVQTFVASALVMKRSPIQG